MIEVLFWIVVWISLVYTGTKSVLWIVDTRRLGAYFLRERDDGAPQ